MPKQFPDPLPMDGPGPVPRKMLAGLHGRRAPKKNKKRLADTRPALQLKAMEKLAEMGERPLLRPDARSLGPPDPCSAPHLCADDAKRRDFLDSAIRMAGLPGPPDGPVNLNGLIEALWRRDRMREENVFELAARNLVKGAIVAFGGIADGDFEDYVRDLAFESGRAELAWKCDPKAYPWAVPLRQRGLAQTKQPALAARIEALHREGVTARVFADLKAKYPDALAARGLADAVTDAGAGRVDKGKGRGGKEPTHSPDFTSVNWFGTRYQFAKNNQAECVRVLWQAWEEGGHSVSSETLWKECESSAYREFRLDHVFRVRKGKKYVRHPAWGSMIQNAGTKGCYRLVEPT